MNQIIRKNFNVINTTNKTQELKDSNSFGYKGLHLDVRLKEERKALEEYQQVSDFPVEIQIRTIIQHAWSSLEHKIIYKKNNSVELTRAANRLAALFEIADSEFIQLREKTKSVAKEAEIMIESAETSITTGSDVPADASKIIDFVTFNKFLNMKYNSNFFFSATNSLLEEIFRNQESFSLTVLTKAYEQKKEVVEAYKTDNIRILSMNPLTQLRHILYAYDSEDYKNLLTDFQRSRFDEYLKVRS